MPNLFPVDAGITQMRGALKIVKDNGGSMGLAELADEAEEKIDDLFPVLDACKLLKFAEVKDGKVQLTKEGMELNLGNMQKVIKEKLAEIEPFKTVVVALRVENNVSTKKLLEVLSGSSILFFSDQRKSEEALRKILLKWGVRVKLLYYDQGTDSWKLA